MNWESTATPADAGRAGGARGVAVRDVDAKSDATVGVTANGRGPTPIDGDTGVVVEVAANRGRGTPTESGRDGRAR